jgi:hypothetical protein
MAEVGSVTCARVALRVGRVALPAYRSTFAQRQLQRPPRLAVRCPMRDEAWPVREAEARPAEHPALRAALGLQHVPDDPTVYRLLRRPDEAAPEQVVSAVARRPALQPGRRVTAAVDATGLAPGASSPCFVKRVQDRGEGFPWRHRLTWTMAVEVDSRVMLAQTARRGPTNGCATLRPLVDAAHQRLPIGVVLADAACDRERRHQHIRQVLQAHRVMPARRGGAAWRVQGGRAQRRQELPAPLYRRR